MEKIEAVRLLHELRTSGYLTEEEFEQKISEVLGKRGIRESAREVVDWTKRQPIRAYKKRHENKSKRWTPEEDKFILSHADESKGWIARKLGRTRYAISTRVAVLKVKRGNQKVMRNWTADEEEFIVKYRDKLSREKIAQMLHRTEEAVKLRMKIMKKEGRLQGSKIRIDEPEENDEYILTNYGQMTSEEIAKNLGIKAYTVRNRIKVLQNKGKLKHKYSKKREDDGTVQVGENRYPREFSYPFKK